MDTGNLPVTWLVTVCGTLLARIVQLVMSSLFCGCDSSGSSDANHWAWSLNFVRECLSTAACGQGRLQSIRTREGLREG